MSVRRTVFGSLPTSGIVHKYELENESGSLKVVVVDYGATLLSVRTPDRNGRREEITLNHYSDIEALIAQQGKRYFGCIAGRFANRIAKGEFALDGEQYTLATNNGVNHLHGGVAGFDTKLWESEVFAEGVGVRFHTTSPHLEEGYPGNLSVVVEYEIVDGDSLVIRFLANTDRATVVNLTNHAYWNLSGRARRTLHDHQLRLHCDHVLPVDETQIPTGEIAPVESLPLFDFREPSRLGDHLANGDIDHCFVVRGALSEDAAGSKTLRPVAELVDPVSGRALFVSSTQPGVQVYTANKLPEAQTPPAGEETPDEDDDGDVPMVRHGAVCLETQHFPDSVHHAHFPSVVVRPQTVSDGVPARPTPGAADYAHETRLSFRVV